MPGRTEGEPGRASGTTDAGHGVSPQPLRQRVAFFLTAAVALCVVVTLPFSLKAVVDEILGRATSHVIQITPPGAESVDRAMPERLRDRERDHTRLHLAIVAIDEVKLLATIRVSGHHRCSRCGWSHRVRLVSISDDDDLAQGLPPSAAVTLSPTDVAVSETVQLPIRGHPVHYPFDRYELALGVVYQRMFPDGKREVLTPATADDRLYLSLQELLPRSTIDGPFPLDPRSLRSIDDPFEYYQVFSVTFARPPYVRFLAVILVVLVAAAAAYSVFLRPLHDLVVNAGALVLGVWGIRSILTPGDIMYITAVDLSLSMVIIFLLGAITLRTLLMVSGTANLTLSGLRAASSRAPWWRRRE